MSETEEGNLSNHTEIVTVKDTEVQHVESFLINYGEATAEVEPGFYSEWMKSIKGILPKELEWGRDIVADVTFGKIFGNFKVTWKAKTPLGGRYLNTMLESLSRESLPTPQGKLENK